MIRKLCLPFVLGLVMFGMMGCSGGSGGGGGGVHIEEPPPTPTEEEEMKRDLEEQQKMADPNYINQRRE